MNDILNDNTPQKSTEEIESRFFKSKTSKVAPSPSKQIVTIRGSSSPVSDQGWKAFKKAPTPPAKTQTVRTMPTADEVIEDVTTTAATELSTVRSKTPDATGFDNAPLNLEVATARRLDWTPPSKSASTKIDLGISSEDADSHSVEGEDSAQRFDQMLSAFRMQDTSTKSSAAGSTDEESALLRKRKLIECVTTKPLAETVIIEEPSTVKQKAPKKKARTITDLATAAYRLPEETLPRPSTTTTSTTSATGSNSNTPAADTNTTAKGKKPVRKRATKVKKKKTPPPKPILLSPGAALKQVSNQDFVFGTSSQLAGDQSPSFLRDLAAAMRRSNQMDSIDEATPLNSDAIEPAESRPSLWQAAARDTEGDLFDVNIQDIAQLSPELPSPAKQDDPYGYVKADASFSADDSFLDLSDIIEPLNKSQDAKAPVETEATQGNGKIIAEDATTAATASEKPEPPKFELYSDAQLAREVSANGFKDVKARKARIALLEKCWQSKHNHRVDGRRMASTQAGMQSQKSAKASPPPKTPIRPVSPTPPDFINPTAPDSQEPPPSAQPVTTPKRPRGRPTKAESAVKAKGKTISTAMAPITPRRTQKTVDIVEIPDSDSEQGNVLSSSAMSSPAQCFSSPEGVDLSVSMEEDADISLNASVAENDESSVSGYIAKAIKSAPASKDPLNPSWHEKILMYDPIIIEELTTWLNSGQLTKVGYDDEVPTGEVKKWCESKSICCVWQTNLRGKERKRL